MEWNAFINWSLGLACVALAGLAIRASALNLSATSFQVGLLIAFALLVWSILGDATGSMVNGVILIGSVSGLVAVGTVRSPIMPVFWLVSMLVGIGLLFLAGIGEFGALLILPWGFSLFSINLSDNDAATKTDRWQRDLFLRLSIVLIFMSLLWASSDPFNSLPNSLRTARMDSTEFTMAESHPVRSFFAPRFINAVAEICKGHGDLTILFAVLAWLMFVGCESPRRFSPEETVT